MPLYFGLFCGAYYSRSVKPLPLVNKTDIGREMEQLKVCVIIPTYNNVAALPAVVSGAMHYTPDVIVVNDGSDDGTTEFLAAHSEIRVITHARNLGKGTALRNGFKKAFEWGFRYAITIDADGQHFASDIPVFIEKLQSYGPALIMGARNMEQESVPGRSSFGNRFSNFWYKVETGIVLPDTQTGYRLYPLTPISQMNFFTRRFEFEIEVIVRLAWAGVPVVSVPVAVYYPPAGERVSHFRPVRDFSRISLVNTVLVAICFFYIWPRNFVRRFYKNRNWKAELRKLLSSPGESDLTKVNSIAFGGFMGVLPIWGFQLIVGIPLAHIMRLNKALFILAANISLPPMIPLIVFLSYELGRPWMGHRAVNISMDRQLTLDRIGANFEQYIYGACTLAVLTGIALWLTSFIFMRLYRRSKRKANNIEQINKENNGDLKLS